MIGTFAVLLLLVSIILEKGDGVYFSMHDVELNIPGNRSVYPPRNHPLITLNALTEQGEADIVRYSLEDNKKKYLQVFPSTGDIMFTNTFLKEMEKDLSIQVRASVVDSAGRQDATSFRVNISSLDIVDCDLIIPDLCYWQSAGYRIFENREPAVIGTLSSSYLTDICAGFKLNYTIAKGGSKFKLVPPTGDNKSWSVRTRKPLERDIFRTVGGAYEHRTEHHSGEMQNFTVICSVQDPQGTRRELTKKLTVRVLDEDDNVPEPQETGDVEILMDSNVVEKGQSVKFKHNKGSGTDLLFIDRDSPAVNNYDIRILNDTKGLYYFWNRTLEDDREQEAQTVIHFKLFFNRSMEIPQTPYTVVLQINDTSLVPGYNKSFIRIPIHLHAVGVGEFSAAHLMSRSTLKPLLLYPTRELTIFRSAAPLARITQPKESLASNATNFTLKGSSAYGKAFNITNTEGILYVNNRRDLMNITIPARLTIGWYKNGKYEEDDLIIKIIIEPSTTCAKNKSWTHCARFLNPDECEEACAFGTGGAVSVKNIRETGGPKRCMWRGQRQSDPVSDRETQMYATCTPDIKTCPDGVCDALELLHFKLCPQDCSEHTTFPIIRNNETNRGIALAAGACMCDETGSCTCNHKIPPPKQKKKTNPERMTTKTKVEETATPTKLNISTTSASPSRHTGPEIAMCGSSCLLGILAGGLFLLCAIAVIVVCLRFDKVHKVRGKYSTDNNDISAPLSEYVDRGVVPENTLTLNFDMTTSLSQQAANKVQPDPKWEFPRTQLIIEQTLGEGEFGRVLRARAKDIAGITGYTVVAVKTLKEDARNTELDDLLSEYHLLKEVSHPNIIKLLGASTIAGGPVYLIIEFAQYGSLRSYLRRSRHLKSESYPPSSIRTDHNTIPKNDAYDEPKNCKITPTDILSFAWQISNGMNYLTDIKLVHRDLAARNVLLTAEKICKISDFGLTRDIYEDDAYFKRSKGRVPVKWMAPESLSDHIYTSKSDVWSFGILVWELVTLGATPYPGIQVHNLFHLLKSGYRMERPEHCSVSLYKIMKSCWQADPEDRPTFLELASKWERMLGDQVEYLDLTPNAIHNRSYFCTIDGKEEDSESKSISNCSSEATTRQESFGENLDKNQENHEKSGETEKLLEPKLDKSASPNLRSPLRELNTQGYESPIKIRNKTERATTPTNENPQYYTNMDAGNDK